MSEEQQYLVLVEKILKAGWLKTHPEIDDPMESLASGWLAGGFRTDPTDAVGSRVVCFCDIPVTDLTIHMDKYSQFGLSFLKPFLIGKGANPVLYVANSAPTHPMGLPGSVGRAAPREGAWSRREVFQGALDLWNDFQWAATFDEPSPFRAVEPGQLTKEADMFHTLNDFLTFYVFSFIKYFEDATSDEDSDNVYMEREWRVLGDVNFSLPDVHRVFIPEHYAHRFRADLPEYAGQLTFSDNI